MISKKIFILCGIKMEVDSMKVMFKKGDWELKNCKCGKIVLSLKKDEELKKYKYLTINNITLEIISNKTNKKNTYLFLENNIKPQKFLNKIIKFSDLKNPTQKESLTSQTANQTPKIINTPNHTQIIKNPIQKESLKSQTANQTPKIITTPNHTQIIKKNPYIYTNVESGYSAKSFPSVYIGQYKYGPQGNKLQTTPQVSPFV